MIGKTQLRRPSPAPAASGPTVADRMVQQECVAAAAFESRWTLRALRRVDGELCEAIEDQLSLFHEALVTASDEALIVEHGEAMCRGWSAAVRRMESAAEPDDAYLLGICVKTGLKVAISDQRAASARVREVHGERAIFMTPDEAAAMVAGLQGIAAVKALWPNSEVIEVRGKGALAVPPEAGGPPGLVELYPDEPAQEDE